MPTPLAVGEDRAGLDDFMQILDHDVDYVRADATVCGGITEFLRIAALAGAHGRSVSPHVFPEIHVHLAAALPNVMAVETLDQSAEVTPIYRLVRPIDVYQGQAGVTHDAGYRADLRRGCVAALPLSVSRR